MSARNTAETHALGFALLGWAWPAFIIAGRILLWIVTAIVIVALAVAAAVRWMAEPFRVR